MFLAEVGGYEVSTAQHGIDALFQLNTSPSPDVIVSDLNMPHMSGFDFLSIVRHRFPGIPVLVFSGAFQSGDSGPDGVIADAFLPKGENPTKLLDTVAGLIRGAQALTIRQQSTPI
jgi:CheY-like chemotaxis protein